MNNSTIYENYKTLRNQITNYEVVDSLYVIWAYGNLLSVGRNLPSNIESIFRYTMSPEKLRSQLQEWDLEMLLREIILNCEEGSYTQKSLKTAKEFRKTHAKLKNFDDFVSLLTFKSGSFIEFNRMSHKQFRWQLGIEASKMVMSLHLYNTPEINEIIKSHYNLEYIDILVFTYLLIYHFQKHFFHNYPINHESKSIGIKFNVFIDKFSISLSDLKSKIKEIRKYNENILYEFNPLRQFPLIKHNNKIFCPFPFFLYWSLVDGVYYELVPQKNELFNKNYGNNFQSYIGNFLNKILSDSSIKIHPEHIYKLKLAQSNNASIDWIVEDENAYLFVECKTKRLLLKTKTELNISEEDDSDLKFICNSILQMYKTFSHFITGYYQNIQYNEEKSVYLCLTMLDELFAYYESYRSKIENYLKKLFEKEENVNLIPLVEKFTYIIRSSGDFEIIIRKIKIKGIRYTLEKEKDYRTRNDIKIDHNAITLENLEELKKIVSVSIKNYT
jgi:hypothetical protein